MIDLQTDMAMRRAAAIAARATHERIRGSHDDKDPDIETGSIDANGNLIPAQSTISIPPSTYRVSPRVLNDWPDFGAGFIVLFVWADQGRNRRAFVIDVLDVPKPSAETATINADGTLTTLRGSTVDAADWSRTLSTTNTLSGHQVVIVWADTSANRKAYAVAEL
jgi:hypothetical protein